MPTMALAGVAQLVEALSHTKRLGSPFLVRTHNQVAGSVPGWGMYGKQSISLLLSLSPPSFPPFLSKINKYI